MSDVNSKICYAYAYSYMNGFGGDVHGGSFDTPLMRAATDMGLIVDPSKLYRRPAIMYDGDTIMVSQNPATAYKESRQLQAMKIGRLCKEMFPRATEQQITELVLKLKAEANHSKIRVTTDMDEIIRLVMAENSPKTCMTTCMDRYLSVENVRHPYEAYDPALGWGLAYSLDTDNSVASRAIVNVRDKVFTRAFNNQHSNVPCDITEAMLKAAGYTKIASWAGYVLADIKAHDIKHQYEGTVVPYLDGCDDIRGKRRRMSPKLRSAYPAYKGRTCIEIEMADTPTRNDKHEYVSVHMSNGLYNECYAGYIKKPCYECGTATEQVWVYDNEFICGECKGRYETSND